MSRVELRRMSRWCAVAALGLAVACGGDETQPTEDHTPESFTLIVDGQAQSPPYVLTAGQTSRVQIKFFNAAGQDLDDVEAGHFAGLSFNPSSLASISRVADHHFQFDVTPSTVGGGTLQVGFGHDDAADEKIFPAEAVDVRDGASGDN